LEQNLMDVDYSYSIGLVVKLVKDQQVDEFQSHRMQYDFQNHCNK
jgi:hypothetical protein